jgi:hypothetical protein
VLTVIEHVASGWINVRASSAAGLFSGFEDRDISEPAFHQRDRCRESADSGADYCYF